MTTLAIHYLKKSKFDEARAYISKSFDLINQLYGPDWPHKKLIVLYEYLSELEFKERH